jgi:hypothetical protein
MLRAAKAHALTEGGTTWRPTTSPAILPQTAAHRLIAVGASGRGAREQVQAMLDACHALKRCQDMNPAPRPGSAMAAPLRPQRLVHPVDGQAGAGAGGLVARACPATNTWT